MQRSREHQSTIVHCRKARTAFFLVQSLPLTPTVEAELSPTMIKRALTYLI